MSQSSFDTTSATLRSMSGLFGDLQFVSHASGVLLDMQARQYDTSGTLHRQHAVASLSLDDARRARDLLDAAIEAAEVAEPRQPGLWSGATVRAIAHRQRSPRQLQRRGRPS